MALPDSRPGPRAGAWWVRLAGLTRAFIRFWAWGFGGGLLVAIVLMTAYSAGSNFLLNRPIPGDFEIVQMGVAIAAFAFLPLAQVARANVVVDIFTKRAGPRLRRALDLLGALAALAFSALLLWRMSEGMMDYYEYSEYTPIVGIPVWVAFPPILVSLLLLFIGALISAGEILGLLPQPHAEPGAPAGME